MTSIQKLNNILKMNNYEMFVERGEFYEKVHFA
jgi:hypothetical protein